MTKTFDELKRLAIQIRDEQFENHNTATRVGTQMVEMLSKLELDFYSRSEIDTDNQRRDEGVNNKIVKLQTDKADKTFVDTANQTLRDEMLAADVNLQTQVDDNTEDVRNLQKSDANLQSQVDTANIKITAQNAKIASLMSQIDALKKQVDDLIAGGGINPDINDALMLANGNYLQLCNGNYLKINTSKLN